MLNRDSGIVPLMELLSTSNVSRDISSDSSVGIVPDRPLTSGSSQVIIAIEQKYDRSNHA